MTGQAQNAKILVKGQGAAPGIASGKVVIIRDVKDTGSVKEGDILVTRMTNPDMVPAMRKVAAIVTDEGGMTCHAAIVSRELGTPAVVGTKTATNVLKNGQLVTVDGEKGLIYEGAIAAPAPEGRAPQCSRPRSAMHRSSPQPASRSTSPSPRQPHGQRQPVPTASGSSGSST